MKRFLTFAIAGIMGCSLFFGAPQVASADTASYYETIQRDGLVFAYVSDSCRDSGSCQLEDIVQVFVNLAHLILAVSGSLMLLIVVYGGFLWLTSGGNSQQIEKGKNAMIGSVIGLLIVFGAFTGVSVLTDVLRDGTLGQVNYCELVSEEDGGKAGQGYACTDTSGQSGTEVILGGIKYECLTGLCPGDEDIRCCKAVSGAE